MWSQTLVYSLVLISIVLPGQLCYCSGILFNSDTGQTSQDGVKMYAIQQGAFVDIEFTVETTSQHITIEITNITNGESRLVCQILNECTDFNGKDCDCKGRDYRVRIDRKVCWKMNHTFEIVIKQNSKFHDSQKVVVYPEDSVPCATDDGDVIGSNKGNSDGNSNISKNTEHASYEKKDDDDDDDDDNMVVGLQTPMIAAIVGSVTAAVIVIGAVIIGLCKRHQRGVGGEEGVSRASESGRQPQTGAATDDFGYAVVRDEYPPAAQNLAPGIPRGGGKAKSQRAFAEAETNSGYAVVYDSCPSEVAVAPGMPRYATKPLGAKARQPAPDTGAEEQTVDDGDMYVPVEVIKERKRKKKLREKQNKS